MPISEFPETIQNQLIRAGIKELNEQQRTFLKHLKSGKDFVFVDFDVYEMILQTCLNICKTIQIDESELLPRVLVICNDTDLCYHIEEKINSLAKLAGLVTVTVHDKGNKIQQRNELYSGIDVVIGNPKRICELYFQNGINLKHLKQIYLIDTVQIVQKNGSTSILRLNESIKKCQKICYISEINPKAEKLFQEFLIQENYILNEK